MNVESVKIRNFRNLISVDYEPNCGLNVLLGRNAQGKTNILEAIFVLATGNTFRKAVDKELLNYESSSFTIQARYSIDERSYQARLDYNNNGLKRVTINNKKSQFNHRDRLKVVLFTPDDLYLVKGAPGKRRAFLDFMLRQISDEYIHNMDDFTSLLRKRNLFLKDDQTRTKGFTIINDLFIEKASALILQRLNFVNILDETCAQIYKKINESSDELKTRYALSFNIDNDKINMDVLQQAMLKHIEDNVKTEIKRRKTLLGPHLEDINLYLDGRMARVFASQGQQRNIAISMKLAELYAYKKITGICPILLLDEVLAELDETKRSNLMNFLQRGDFQTFLTSVDMESIDQKRGSIQVVDNGCLWRKE